MRCMPNTPTPEMPTPRPKSSPNILEWILVALVILTLVGLGVLFTLIQQLNQSVSSTNMEVMEIRQDLMEQKEAMMEEGDTMEEAAMMEENTAAGSYTNAHYQFSIDIPAELNYCLNDFCQNDVEDADIQHVTVSGHDLLQRDGFEREREGGLIDFSIAPARNGLGMSAVEFAKRSLELNQQYRPREENYMDEIETIFAGEPAYAFTATDGFEERGLSYTDSNRAVQDDSRFYEQAGLGLSLATPHRVIYLDHDGTFYRILYPLNSETAVDMINSFRFLQ